MNQQIKFITKNNTNMKINTQVLSVTDMNALAISINELMEEHRKLEIALQKTNKSFRETITNVSHDLRTPLTSANGYIQLLNNDEIPEEKKKKYITIIEERIFSVKSMLDQLFEYAKIEAEEYEFNNEKININTILAQTISEFYDDFTQKGMEPEIAITSEMLYLYGDAKALTRVFQNIIGNAIMHGEGDIHISLEHKEEGKVITFSNKTKTIEEKDIHKLFERFYTTDKSRTKKTTGLGLSIAKNFVVQMKGTIDASLENHQFTISIYFK